MLKKENIKDIYRLAPMQEGMYFHYLQDPASPVYFEQLSYRLQGVLDIAVAEKTMNYLVSRYDILRAVFNHEKADVPLQIILKERKADFTYQDIRNVPDAEQYVSDYKKLDRERTFDLQKDSLLRVTILQVTANEYEFILSHHHILMDGWCMGILFSEYLQVYEGYRAKKPVKLPEVKQYGTYLSWLAAQDENKSLSYWKDYLDGYSEAATLPRIAGANENAPYEHACEVCMIGAGDTKALRLLASAAEVTLNTLIQSIWGLLLARYNNRMDVVFGSVVSGRPAEIDGIEDMLGLFINTVPVRIAYDENTNFGTLLRSVQQRAIESEPFHYTSLAAVQGQSELKHALLDHIIVFRNHPVSAGEENAGQDASKPALAITGTDAFEQTNYHFILSVEPHEHKIEIEFRYNAAVYSSDTMTRLSAQFMRIVEQVVKENNIHVNDIGLVSDLEKQQLLHDFNCTKAEYPSDKTICALFGETAIQFPGHTAVVFGNTSLTYKELDVLSSQLAALLREKGVQHDDVIALLTERSLEMVIGIFGILKAGAAYLPVDPSNPADRRNFIISDSRARLVLVHGQEYPQSPVEVIDIGNRSLYSSKKAVAGSFARPQNLAYIIYTSGSTGLPKGAMIEHHSLVNRLHWMRKAYPIGAGDTILQKTPYTFDVSVWELLLWSITGAKLVLLQPGAEKDPEEIITAIRDHRVTMMHFVPSMLKAFLKYLEAFGNAAETASLKYVICSGEALGVHEADLFGRLVTEFHGTELINLYGPTEATIDVSYFRCTPGENRKTIPIGKPIDNTQLLVLDQQNRLVPAGVAGELYLAGVGLARGYVNNEKLTAERFVPNPFMPGERMYRTGDLARWLSDGNVEYLGRLDDQVKIRGYRIELGEIENCLKKQEAIRDAVVTVNGSGDEKILCAYFIADEAPDTRTLQEFLQRLLPAYMIPAHFMQVKEIPLSRNGKLDKKALPAFTAAQVQYLAPRNETEQKLAECWSQVLGIEKEKIGVNDNYFSLGGDSIKAIRLLTRISKATGRKLRVHELFAHPTIASLGLLFRDESGALAGEKISEVNDHLAKLKQNVLAAYSGPSFPEDVFPMSDIQKGMVFYSLKESAQSTYHDQFIYQRRFSDFDLPLFNRALALMSEKHPELRTGFNFGDYSEPVQLVWKTIPAEAGFSDLSGMTPGAQQDAIRKAIAEDRADGFDVSMPPLWRMKIFATGAGGYCFLWSFHHAILDGWSNASLMTELNNTYLELKNNPAYRPVNLKSGYRDFIVHSLAENKTEAIRYWKKELDGYTRISFDGLGNASAQPGKEVLKKTISRNLYDKIAAECVRRGISMKHFCFASYLYALYMISPKADLVTGLVSNMRPLIEDGDKMLGCFLNTIPVRMQIPRHTDWYSYLALVDSKLVDLKKYDRLSLREITVATGEKTSGGNPFFDTIFNYVDFHIYDSLEEDTAPVAAAENEELSDIEGFENTNTFFDFSVLAGKQNIEYEIIYAPQFISSGNAERMMNWFEVILEKIASATNEPARKESIISDQEKKIIQNVNETAADFPEHQTLHELFREQCAETPLNVALISGNTTYTYSRLDRLSSDLAVFLQEKGAGNGSIVGICMERTPLMIVSLLAILKAGAAYLPLDPAYPEERKKFILEDSGAAILLADKREEELAGSKFELVDLSGWSATEDQLREPASGSNPGSLAYVIYTSGSTGRPKGVMVSHASVVNLALAQKKYFGITPAERILQFTTITFDASVEQLWLALLSGAALVLVEKELLNDPARFAAFITANEVTHLHAVPSFLQTVDAEQISCLRRVVSGGDTCSPLLASRWAGKCRFYNEYGPTETTVTSVEYEVTGELNMHQPLPIGKPLANTQVYILDEHGMQQPAAVAGELYIGGKGVAQGYLGNELLTREKFKPDPYRKGGKLYRTGDMARLREDGNLEFLGRADDQVKIRGYRIEPGEIENCIRSLPLVKDALVIAAGAGQEKQISAYYVTENGIAVADLRSQLASKLPEYMVPAYIHHLDRIPLLHNGKPDRNALPAPGAHDKEPAKKPRNAHERKLRALWAEVLGLPEENISADTNFFDLGGHSLLVAVLTSRIHKAFHIPVPVPEFFRMPTIEALASFLQQSSVGNYSAIAPAAAKEYYPVSSVQKRLFVLQQFNPSGTVYNIPMEFPVGKNADTGKIRRALARLIARHESLRTSFEVKEDDPVQVIHPEVNFELETLDCDAAGFEALRENFIRPFDLGKAPLLRAAYVRVSDAPDYLLLDMHHIITDAVSHNILEREFHELYTGEEPAPLRLQYKDYSEWLNSPEQQAHIKAQENYWLELFSDEIPVLDLPYDNRRPAVQSFDGAFTRFVFTQEETEQLKKTAAGHGATVYMSLFAAISILVAKLAGKEDVIIGTPVAARRHADLENIVGMFVNTLPVRSFPAKQKTAGSFLEETKNQAVQAFENQDYTFEDLVEKLPLSRDLSRNPLFDVMFNLMNSEEEFSPADGSGRHERTRSKFDLSFTATVSPSGIAMDVVYCRALFQPATIDRFIRYIRQIVQQFSEEKTIGEIELLTEEEKQNLLYGINATAKDFGTPCTIHALFERQAALTPDKIAVCCGDKKRSYRELNDRAAYWAAELKKQGVGRNDVVALHFNHSPGMIIGLLAVLKTGAAYLPLNTELPRNMISYILSDSRAKLLLAEKPVEFESVQTVLIHDEETATPPAAENTGYPSDPVYVIYTSGTTGRPKGVVVKHENLFNYLHWFRDTAGLSVNDKTVLATLYAYDLGYTSLFTSLVWGCELYLLEKDAYSSAESFAAFLADNRITYFKLTPSLYSYVKNAKEFRRALDSLRLIVLGGEKINPADIQDTLALNDEVRFINHYGPTEATIGCITHSIGAHNIARFIVRPVIGSPITNVQVYILDAEGRLQPEGVTGEICIGGNGLSAGYLHNEELTRTKFTANPAADSGRIYRTGDLGRIYNGLVEFLGRADHQLKLRGYRVELQEIERSIQRCSGVDQCCVVAYGTYPDNYLAAYYTGEASVTEDVLRSFLQQELPAYMMPQFFSRLETMPVTRNGKVDQKQLPEPSFLTDSYVAPADETQQELAAIWSSILQVPLSAVGANSDFFSMGGHSLKAMRLSSGIRTAFGVEITIMEIFTLATIEAIAARIKSLSADNDDVLLSELENMSQEELDSLLGE